MVGASYDNYLSRSADDHANVTTRVQRTWHLYLLKGNVHSARCGRCMQVAPGHDACTNDCVEGRT